MAPELFLNYSFSFFRYALIDKDEVRGEIQKHIHMYIDLKCGVTLHYINAMLCPKIGTRLFSFCMAH